MKQRRQAAESTGVIYGKMAEENSNHRSIPCLVVPNSTEYNARGAGFSKSCLSDFLESSRNHTVPGEEADGRENTRENSNLPTAVQSPRTVEGKDTSRSKGQIK